jgi:hypothetical protein
MTTLRRLFVAVSVLAVGLSGQVIPAAASAHGPTAGSVHTTILSAAFSSVPADFSQPQLSIFVDDITTQSNPLSGPSTLTHQTDVNISFSSDSGFGFGCLIIDNPSNFTMSSDLQSASLHTTFTDTTATCDGFPASFHLPLTVDVVWTGTGPLVPVHATTRSVCGGYHTQALTTYSSNVAAATATLSPLFTDPFTGNQGTSLFAYDDRLHIDGTSPPTCEVGVGRGSVAGALPAGTYRTTVSGAGSYFNDDVTQTSFGISATTTTSSINPKVGTSTSTNETDVQIFENSPDFFGFGCFVLDTPSDFTVGRGLQSASVHTTITDSTAQCSDFPPSDFTLPLTLDVTWTAIGPLASLRGVAHNQCLTNRTEGSSLTQGTNATATANISGVDGTLTTNFATIGLQDTTTHAEGEIQPTC